MSLYNVFVFRPQIVRPIVAPRASSARYDGDDIISLSSLN